MLSRTIIQESLPLYVERKDGLAAVKNFKCKQSYLRVGGRDPSPLPSYPQCAAGIHLFAVIPAVSGGYPSERNPRWMPD
jgi:hypothetical protein